ncbi:paired small multidrug resistance pump [Metabacillus crassostreae]|uniref:DMT family transporter n=1 Tax=Metabacillus crassostreae TaxID=929098 RepID=UPI0019578696|nr:multidrug efflux SMR transporter [Metabacillus crassostreae]MBM7605862.1 paired small multidrug resistance pump [Metabacillus crassostreae]
MNKNWLIIYIAAFFEVCWVSGLKYSTTLTAWGGTVLAIMISFYLLIKATSQLPITTAYAVFTGLGAAGTVISEILFFGTELNWLKIGLCAILITGVVGLKLVTTDGQTKREGV